jgi:hopene-associated glycosyltransferase HpnB
VANELVASMVLAIWLYLLAGRGAFWRGSERDDQFPVGEGPWPSIAAIIPARDEAECVGETVASLLRQDYPGEFTVILVDDQSRDGTALVACDAAEALGAADRLTVLSGRPLPPGWTGKLWAQSQGVEAAEAMPRPAQYILFTDADIVYMPNELRKLAARAQSGGYVLTSLMAKLRCESFAERMFIPAFIFFFQMLYPFAWANDPRRATAAAAGGCMLVRRTALEEAGGIESIRAELIDDCSLAARIKHRGEGRHPIRLDVAARSVSLRPYDNSGEIWNMIARTAFTQLRYSGWLLAGTLAGMTIIYLIPPIAALLLGPLDWPAWLAWAAMCCAYAPMLRYYGRSPLWAPFLPLVALFYVGATFASAVRYWRGKGGQWKARVQAPVQQDR